MEDSSLWAKRKAVMSAVLVGVLFSLLTLGGGVGTPEGSFPGRLFCRDF